ncbi:MAG: PCYCGC motif-containing (lipo)protein [Thermoleophilia bacterium]
MAKKKKKPAGGNAAGKKGGSSSSLSIVIFAAVVIAVGLVGGVMGWVLTRGGDDAGSGGVKLPDYINGPTVPKGTAEAYQFAVDNQDVLKYIPCYCGCGQLDGHTSNLDCFIASGSGSDIVFDKHAAG